MKFNLDDIKKLIEKSKYKYGINDWFFPADLIPHSSTLKYACKKLYEAGYLDRIGSVHDRWGYRYRIKFNSGQNLEVSDTTKADSSNAA